MTGGDSLLRTGIRDMITTDRNDSVILRRKDRLYTTRPAEMVTKVRIRKQNIHTSAHHQPLLPILWWPALTTNLPKRIISTEAPRTRTHHMGFPLTGSLLMEAFPMDGVSANTLLIGSVHKHFPRGHCPHWRSPHSRPPLKRQYSHWYSTRR